MIRRLGIALGFLVINVAYGQQAGTADLVFTTEDLVLTSTDIVSTVTNLALVVQDMVTVSQTPKETRIELPGDILFDFDKATLRPEAVVALSAAAELIARSAKGTVRVEGHTDAKGTPAYNLKLSQDRANAVKGWLIQKGGLNKVVFALAGYGASRPAAPNTKPDGADDPAGRQRNRRVEIIFAPR